VRLSSEQDCPDWMLRGALQAASSEMEGTTSGFLSIQFSEQLISSSDERTIGRQNEVLECQIPLPNTIKISD